MKTGPSNLIVIESRAIVFNSENRLLLVSRNGQRWSLPGGKVDKHNSLKQLASDEVYEETGLKVKAHSLAYYLQGKWNVRRNFWHFNEEIDYPFTAHCVVFVYHCDIIESEIFNKNWTDLAHDVIKLRKFFTEEEFLDLAQNNNLSQDELINLDFQRIKNMKNEHLFVE